jgi:hypothetical protein
MITELTDLTPMAFGKYTGTPMQDVPASYLHYLWTKYVNKIKTDVPEDVKLKPHEYNSLLLAKYIKKNLDALKLEDEDLIW